MRRTYNPVRRVRARPEGPNPSGSACVCYHVQMKVPKDKFDNVLGRLLQESPKPLKKIKTRGRRGPKTPILVKQS